MGHFVACNYGVSLNGEQALLLYRNEAVAYLAVFFECAL